MTDIRALVAHQSEFDVEDSLQSILHLQDELLSSNKMYIVDEVISEIARAIPQDGKLLFYMRQPRHFSDPHAAETPYLLFPYLAFEICDGKVCRFGHRTDLQKRALEVAEEYTEEVLSESAVVHWVPHPEISRFFVEQVRRTFLVFYHVSGSREHFIESVSRRFVREFVRSKTGREIIDYDHHFGEIRQRLGIDILLGLQKNPFLKLEDVQKIEDIIDIDRGSSKALKSISKNKDFLKDLFGSIARKSINYGYINKPKTYYCINTLTEEHLFLDRGSQDTAFQVARQAVLIFIKGGDRLSLDAVHNATKLISTSLREQASAEREDPLFKVMRASQDAEERLGTSPVETREALEREIRNILEPFLREVIQASQAEKIAVWRFDPFNKEFVEIASVGFPSSYRHLTIPQTNDVSLCVKSYVTDQPIWQEHRDQYSAETGEQPLLTNDIGKFSDATHARPIWVGSTKSAVIEFASSRAKRLVTEGQYFERVSITCGEVIRRIELANDRSWLSRMSYVHAARHRIEAIIREIQETDEQRADQLRSLLSSYSIVQDSENRFRNVDNIDELADAMVSAMSTVTTSPLMRALCEKVSQQGSEHNASPRSYGLVLEILDTLGSNAGHSPLLIEDVSVETDYDEPSKIATMKILYRPKAALQQAVRLSQVCISPIKDSRSATYHFGLFLLAAQLRMVGGSASAAPMVDDGFGNSLFGVAFSIPLNDSEGAV
ncbi:hypothetical protein [Bradyrhizobium sp. YR681]|uniref:hypothetical protein n=1 Tax=Bradyrhizobium sp. YR681 TaxID=1144344 RepID=UPI00055DA807|nr:hypothetical protein [Bradyrhizobium sp. YR681]